MNEIEHDALDLANSIRESLIQGRTKAEQRLRDAEQMLKNAQSDLSQYQNLSKDGDR